MLLSVFTRLGYETSEACVNVVTMGSAIDCYDVEKRCSTSLCSHFDCYLWTGAAFLGMRLPGITKLR